MTDRDRYTNILSNRTEGECRELIGIWRDCAELIGKKRVYLEAVEQLASSDNIEESIVVNRDNIPLVLRSFMRQWRHARKVLYMNEQIECYGHEYNYFLLNTKTIMDDIRAGNLFALNPQLVAIGRSDIEQLGRFQALQRQSKNTDSHHLLYLHTSKRRT